MLLGPTGGCWSEWTAVSLNSWSFVETGGHFLKWAILVFHGRSLVVKSPNNSLCRLGPFMDAAPVNTVGAAPINELGKREEGWWLSLWYSC